MNINNIINNFDPFYILNEHTRSDQLKYFRNNKEIIWNEQYQCWILFNYDHVKSCVFNYELYSLKYEINFLNTLNNISIGIYPRTSPPEYLDTRSIMMNNYKNSFNDEFKNSAKYLIQKEFNSKINQKINLIEFINNLCAKIVLKFLKFDIDIYKEFLRLIQLFLSNQSISHKNKIYYELENFCYSNNPQHSNFYNLSVMVGGLGAMSGSLLALIRDISIYNNIAKNNSYYNFIQESLRLSSIYSYIARKVTKDVEINDSIISTGQTVLALIGSANRDEKKFGLDSDNFNINRNYDSINLAFGSGIHRCIGMPLNLFIMEEILKYLINYNIYIHNTEYDCTIKTVGYQFKKFDITISDL